MYLKQLIIKKISQRAILLLSLGLFFVFCLSTTTANAQYDNAYVSYNDFYQELAPYGQWISDPQYGYVWSPNADGDFRPYYTSGHWVMTEYGNTWVSDYPWGWACFHYGRWTYDNYYGWLWIPGSDWGPAWVSWRYGDGFYGWAPLGPGYSDFNTDYYCPNDWWIFIPPQYIYSGNYYRYWYGPRGNSRLVHNTNYINTTYVNNNTTYICGPRARDVEQITHQPVQVYHLTNSNSRTAGVHNNVVKMYRPAQIRPVSSVGGEKVAPPNVVSAPQPVRTSQSVNSGQTTPPQFRNEIPKNVRSTPTPGTGFNETAQPVKPQPRNDNNPYEWDYNKPAQQPAQQENAPQPAPQPQQTRRYESEPMRQQPQPQRQPEPQQYNNRPQPQPVQRAQPAPQQAPRQAPAPASAPRSESGRR